MKNAEDLFPRISLVRGNVLTELFFSLTGLLNNWIDPLSDAPLLLLFYPITQSLDSIYTITEEVQHTDQWTGSLAERKSKAE